MIQPRWFSVFAWALSLLVAAVISTTSQSLLRRTMEQQQQQQHDANNRNSDNDCSTICKKHSQFHGANLLQGEELVRLVTEQRDRFYQQLRQDYGQDTFDKMFFTTNGNGEKVSRGRRAYVSPGSVSWDRMKRKLKMKILTVQIALQKEQSRTCPCDNDDKEKANQRQRRLKTPQPYRHVAEEETIGTDPNNTYYATYIWANGGHSSSAGHGNFFWETYTAVLERTMKLYFGAIGIQFIGRNYAMGGTSSGEEVALCSEQIFGNDIDSLTWDYGMTDSGNSFEWKQLLYTMHTAMLSYRPAAIGIDISNDPHRVQVYSDLEQLGMTAFYQNRTVIKEMLDAIPNTLGKTDDEIAQMPAYVQYMKCGQALENGDPGCKDYKYNKTSCARRKGPAPWHPGWRVHAFTGNTLSLFLGEVLLDAVKEIAALPPTQDLKTLLNQLTTTEVNDYQLVRTEEFPEGINMMTHYTDRPDDATYVGDVTRRELFASPTFCHTAILPAEIRYNGLLTERPNSSFLDYDKGVPQPKATDDLLGPVDMGPMTLAFDPRTRQSCEYNIGVDYKDFFYLDTKHGWKTMAIPNSSEKEYYEVDTTKMMGLIILCFAGCDWNKCAKGDMRNSIRQGNSPLKMEVNGKPVQSFSKPYSEKMGMCWALKGEDGHRWKPNSEGTYDIAAKLDRPEGQEYGFLRFSSFILM